MNIQVQLCGIAVVILLLILSLNRKTIWLRSKRAFLVALISTLTALVFDTLSIIAIVSSGDNFTSFTNTICKIYLVSLVWMAYTMNYYTSVDIGVKNRIIRIHRISARILIITVSIIILLSPVKIHYTDRYDLYTYGPAVMITYVSAFIYVVSNVTILFAFRNKINHRRWIAALSWMLLLVIAAAIQFFHNNLLIIGFASSLGSLIVFIRLENPESFIERETGCFNELAFNRYLEQCYNRGERISMLVVQFATPHYLYERYSTDSINDFLKNFSKILDDCSMGQVFKYREWSYIVIFSQSVSLYSAKDKISKTLDRDWIIDDTLANFELKYTEIPNSFIAKDSDAMIEMIRAFARDYSNSSETELILDKVWAENYKKEQEIEDLIIQAIKNDRIEVYYQPIYSTAKKRFVSAEALVRILDKNGNLIPPNEFIPVAEDTGLILQLGQIVFEKACHFMMKEKLYKKGIDYLEINLSVVQCMRSDLADNYTKIIRKIGIDPKMITLEITESFAISSTENLVVNMEKLKHIGVQFALDDFGTGFSNLDYLLELPIKVVKFDSKMTQAYFESSKRRAVMGSVINMIKAADLEIVAEGVEEKHQLDELSLIDIDFIQGYYFSKPVPPDEFIQLLNKQKL